MMRKKNVWISGVAVFGVVASLGLSARVVAGRQTPAPPPPTEADQLAALKDEGQVIYSRECASCHAGDGTGDGAGPSLAGNTNLSNKDHVVRRILGGTGDGGMDPFGKVLTDRQVAAVATFVRNAWDNSNGVVLEADVKVIRAELAKPK